MGTDRQDLKGNPLPDLDCDIVMAGGVTSGIIYPGAVEQISRHYVFRSIGGTSVGAIAAAVTAAAEYGRLTGQSPHPFREIGGMPTSLGKRAPDKHSRLFHLFTPEDGTRPLYAFVMPMFSGETWPRRFARMAIVSLSTWQVAVPTVLALLIGLALLAGAAGRVAGIGLIVALVIWIAGLIYLSASVWFQSTARTAGGVFVVGLVVITLLSMSVAGRESGALAVPLVLFSIVATIGLAAFAWTLSTGYVLKTRWIPALVANKYGLCTGLTDPGIEPDDKGVPFHGLTNWMHDQVQRAAGRTAANDPLTFGELWSAPDPDPAKRGKDTEGDAAAAPRTIDLAMIASDISRNRTAQLPFLEMQSPLHVEIAVLEAFFPPSIVDWMKKHRQPSAPPFDRSPEIIRLPAPKDLPIVVAARLSLSFPVLMSAFPMLTPRLVTNESGGKVLVSQQVWFSDGGLTSNFPIHFFDSPIPTRPTFCLNLIDYGTGTDKLPARGARRSAKTSGGPASPVPFVSMVEGSGELPVQFTEFDNRGLGAFFSTLLNTARFWSDNELLGAPGVRDRVVNIALMETEGGLNLDMPQPTIDALDKRGILAGQMIAQRFDPAAAPDPETPPRSAFANHRWVRYRNFMAAFEDLSRRFARARRLSDEAARKRREAELVDLIAGNAKGELDYPLPPDLMAFYRSATDDLERLSLGLAAATHADPATTFDRLTEGPDGEGAAPRPKMRFRLRPIVNDDPRLATADLPPEPPQSGGGSAGPPATV